MKGNIQLKLSVDNRIKFGKYKGKLLSDLSIMDPGYVKWAIENGYIKKPKNWKE